MRDLSWRIYLIILFIILNRSIGEAGSELMPIRNLTDLEGLSSIDISDIYQDSKGYIWIGTTNGLNRYDGNNIKRFKTKNSANLSDKITVLFEDENEGFWIGTSYSFGYFDYLTEEIIPAITDTIFLNSLSGLNIRDIQSFDAHHLVIYSYSGVFLYDKLSHQVIRQLDEEDYLLNSKDFPNDKNGSKEKKWVVINQKDFAQKGLAIFNKYDKTSTTYFPTDQGLELRHNIIYDYYFYTDTNLLIVTRRGVLGFNLITNKFTEILNYGHDGNSTLLYYNKKIWVSSLKGLYVAEETANIDNLKFEYIDFFNNLPIHCLAGSDDGLIWVGTQNSGVFVVNPNYQTATPLTQIINQLESAKLRSVKSIYKEKDIIWFGTDGGVVSVNTTNMSYNLFSHNPDDNSSLNIGGVMAILRLNESSIAFANWGGGLNIYNTFTEKISRVVFEPARRNSILDMVMQDSLLILGTKGRGVLIYNLYTNKSFGIEDDRGLDADEVFDILDDGENNFWLATNNGLYKLNGIEMCCEKFFFKHDNDLTDNTYNQLLIENDSLWIAGSEGLFLINNKNGDLLNYPQQNYFSENPVYLIVKGPYANTLWLNCANKLILFNYQSGLINEFSSSDGVPRYITCGIKSGEEEFLFGGLKGVFSISSKKISVDTTPPDICFTSLHVNNKMVTPKNGAIINRVINYTNKLILSYKENSFRIGFTTLEYKEPESCKYKYRLYSHEDSEGPEEWIDAENSLFAAFTNLPPDEYVFHVIASNGDGIWNTKGRKIHILIKPPFWQTNWFRIALSIFTVLLIYVFLAFRTHQLRMHKRILEKQVAERTLQLREANEYKLRFFTNVSHEFKTPLTLLLSPLREAKKRSDTQGYIARHIDIMHTNVERLLELINQIIDIRRIDQKMMNVNLYQGDIIQFLKSKFKTFELHAEEEHIEFEFNSSNEELYTYFDKDKLDKIVLNLLSNAFKHVEDNGRVEMDILFHQDSNDLRIIIANTGQEIAEEDIDKVFERFYQSGNNEKKVSGTGIGLSLTKELVTIMGGYVSVNSKNKRTSFTVILPLQTVQESENLHSENLDLGAYDKETNGLMSSTLTILDELKLKNYSLLLVDDNPDIRKYLKAELNDSFTIYSASNGQEAVQKAIAHNPDVIISDVMMPVMNGFQLLAEVKQNLELSHIPIILLTAKSTVTSEKIAFSGGADAYVKKPFSLELLVIHIYRLLKERERLKEKFSGKLQFERSGSAPSLIDDEFLNKLIAHIEENIIEEQLTPEILARHMGVSTSLLYKKIKTLTSLSTSELVRNVRIKCAVKLLEQRKFTVSEIIYMTGFKSRPYFYKNFKQHFTCTPNEYLKGH